MPLSLSSAGGTKGPLYGDSSYRTAALRKKAIVDGQLQKCGGSIPCSVLSGVNASKKPLVAEHHLQKGSTGGVTELISLKNPNGFI